eukprot:2241853-Lingulodinium_polyedra.AAC.1
MASEAKPPPLAAAIAGIAERAAGGPADVLAEALVAAQQLAAALAAAQNQHAGQTPTQPYPEG